MLSSDSLKCEPGVALLHRRSCSVVDHVINIPGWSMHYAQFSPGKFEGQLTILELEGVQFIRERANRAILKQGKAQKSHVFTFPLYSPSQDFFCAGHQINKQSLLVAPASSLPELRAPEALDLLLISIDNQCLSAVLEDADHTLLRSPHLFPLSSRDNLTRWRQLSDSIGMDDATTASAALLTFPAVRQSLRDTILVYLSEMVEREEVLTLTEHARKRIVDRARDYMLAHCNEPPSILDVCKFAGASRRKLQYCFQETLGMNPICYLRVLRLNGAHHELSKGAATVQTTACHWGFWHLSRFASDYRQLFGETPSTTLRKAGSNFANYG